MNTRKFINKYGNIEEGQLLTNEEVAILEDPLFDTVPFNVAIKGAFYNSDNIQSVLLYILKYFTLTRRNAPTSIAAAATAESVIDDNNVCDQYGEVLDTVYKDNIIAQWTSVSGEVDTNA